MHGQLVVKDSKWNRGFKGERKFQCPCRYFLQMTFRKNSCLPDPHSDYHDWTLAFRLIWTLGELSSHFVVHLLFHFHIDLSQTILHHSLLDTSLKYIYHQRSLQHFFAVSLIQLDSGQIIPHVCFQVISHLVSLHIFLRRLLSRQSFGCCKKGTSSNCKYPKR